MISTIEQEVVAELWQVTHPAGSGPPELTGTPPEALCALLNLLEDPEFPFSVLPTEDDPYPGLAVASVKQYWHHEWAVRVGQLIPIEATFLPDVVFYVDRLLDGQGNHRVYTLVEGERGQPEFGSIDDLLRWMTAMIRRQRGEITAEEVESLEAEVAPGWSALPTWEDNHWAVLDQLFDSPFATAWETYTDGKWIANPPGDPELGAAVEKRPPDLSRRSALWILNTFLSTRQVRLPDGLTQEDLAPVHQELVGHLEDLQRAMGRGAIPSLIEAVAQRDDALGERAVELIARHHQARAPEERERPLEAVLYERLEQLMLILAAQEMIEINSNRLDRGLMQLVSILLAVHTASDLEQKVLGFLMDSEMVVEVYADDAELISVIRETFQGTA
jgi:hypothetical protein